MSHDAGSSRASGVRHFLPQIIHLYLSGGEHLSSGFIHNWAYGSSDDLSCPLSRGSFPGSSSMWMSPIFDWEKLLSHSHHSSSIKFLPIYCRPCFLGPSWILLNYIIVILSHFWAGVRFDWTGVWSDSPVDPQPASVPCHQAHFSPLIGSPTLQ